MAADAVMNNGPLVPYSRLISPVRGRDLRSDSTGPRTGTAGRRRFEAMPVWAEHRCQHFNRQPSNAFYDPAAVSTLPTVEKIIPIFEATAGMNDPAATA